MSIAFFDLDKTLIADNSARLWLNSQWKSRSIKFSHMMLASYWLAKYHLGFTKLDEVVEKGLALMKGESQAQVLEKTKDFFYSTIKNLYRPGALEALHKHREQGDIVSLLTSSFDGLSELVAKDLKLDHCLCTILEVDREGIYTGKTIGPPCFGRNKIIFAQDLCHKLDIPLEQCSFYSDSATDIPLLDLVGQAIAVNPDLHLRTRAQFKKWPVVDWKRP
ncbi:MAG: HAD family hydrolase [Myxococcales bacterium]|nr:HAD family hydrolase [Myxococcales bacterium]USN51512.1 MAG: HAD family hydrolase [Myxococcales bacterium]